MDQDVFSGGEHEFKRRVEQFVKAAEGRQSNEREELFRAAGKVLDILAGMAPNTPIVPVGTGAGGGGSGSSGATGTATHGTCPNCGHLFTMTK
jgi:hypothetical protein